MPEICRFLGIIITMYYGDHAPPHFHARYNQHTAVFDIQQLCLVSGSLPPRALGLVMEWAALNKKALLANWQLAIQGQPLKAIRPLK
jgi:Domain of unknown function (DUF4160)